MAYIQPNSTIEFFGDMNLSDNYDDTLYFATTAAKDAYFTALTKLGRVTSCTYTRENRGYVRVELPMSTLIGATYMRFKNTSFENKWFYAFVKKVDYVNNLTTEIQFELDPIMTWMGTFTLNECYIERQHTLHDGIGNNICEEGLPVGEYINEYEHRLFTTQAQNIFIVYADPDEQGTGGGMEMGIYSANKVFSAPSSLQANAILNRLVGQNLIENVTNVYMGVQEFYAPDMTFPVSHDYTYNKPYSSLNGYVPRNKKLFCYPYKFCKVDNQEGESQEYLYEYFGTLPDQTSTGTFTLVAKGLMGASPEILLAPKNYKNKAENWEERLGMDKFPQCAWCFDSYKAYLAQKNAYHPQAMAMAMTTGAAQGALQGAMKPIGDPLMNTIGGALAGSVTKTTEEVLTNLIENKVRPTAPTVSRGAQNVDVMYAEGVKTFIVTGKCITKNYAMMLDSFFDMFGYAVKQHGVPNMNARPNWTFVKTIGCSIGGNIPADDASRIEDIFNKGVRFWKNHNNIGNYSLNNAPA